MISNRVLLRCSHPGTEEIGKARPERVVRLRKSFLSPRISACLKDSDSFGEIASLARFDRARAKTIGPRSTRS